MYLDKRILIVFGASAASLAYMVSWWNSKRKAAAIRASYAKDTVILHQLSRGPYAPSVSPFPLKLETFLRMANVPYQNDFDEPMSYKGKTPWITLNGKDVADSELSILEVKRVFNLDLDKHLSSQQKGMGRILRRMVDEAFYWVLVSFRWGYGYKYEYDLLLKSFTDFFGSRLMTRMILAKFSRDISKNLWIQGIGRHTEEEVLDICRLDFEAFSDMLGTQMFMLGDQPSEVDAAVFGMLAQIKWNWSDDSPAKKKLYDHKNLLDYCDRMKEKFWPDWDDCITHGCTRKSTK